MPTQYTTNVSAEFGTKHATFMSTVWGAFKSAERTTFAAFKATYQAAYYAANFVSLCRIKLSTFTSTVCDSHGFAFHATHMSTN